MNMYVYMFVVFWETNQARLLVVFPGLRKRASEYRNQQEDCGTCFGVMLDSTIGIVKQNK